MGLSLESVYFRCGRLTFDCSVVYQAKGFRAGIKYPPLCFCAFAPRSCCEQQASLHQLASASSYFWTYPCVVLIQHLLLSAALQDQGPELQRFSVSLSNNTAEKHSPGADGTSMQKQESGCSVEGLCKHDSALTWSERQQLRRTSAAMRHASASRQLPHQEHRIPPGLLPTLLLLLLWLSVSITLSTPHHSFAKCIKIYSN